MNDIEAIKVIEEQRSYALGIELRQALSRAIASLKSKSDAEQKAGLLREACLEWLAAPQSSDAESDARCCMEILCDWRLADDEDKKLIDALAQRLKESTR